MLNTEKFEWVNIPYCLYAIIKRDAYDSTQEDEYCSHFLKKGTVVEVVQVCASNQNPDPFFNPKQIKVRANSHLDFNDYRTETSSLFQYVEINEIDLFYNKKKAANHFIPPSDKKQLPEY